MSSPVEAAANDRAQPLELTLWPPVLRVHLIYCVSLVEAYH